MRRRSAHRDLETVEMLMAIFCLGCDWDRDSPERGWTRTNGERYRACEEHA
jgi:hypothetical protein